MKTEPKPNPLAIQQPCRKYGMDEAIHPLQIAAFRRATPAEKMAQIVQMYHLGIAWRTAGLRMQHPNWSEDDLRREAQRISTYGAV